MGRNCMSESGYMITSGYFWAGTITITNKPLLLVQLEQLPLLRLKAESNLNLKIDVYL